MGNQLSERPNNLLILPRLTVFTRTIHGFNYSATAGTLLGSYGEACEHPFRFWCGWFRIGTTHFGRDPRLRRDVLSPVSWVFEAPFEVPAAFLFANPRTGDSE